MSYIYNTRIKAYGTCSGIYDCITVASLLSASTGKAALVSINREFQLSSFPCRFVLNLVLTQFTFVFVKVDPVLYVTV